MRARPRLCMSYLGNNSAHQLFCALVKAREDSQEISRPNDAPVPQPTLSPDYDLSAYSASQLDTLGSFTGFVTARVFQVSFRAA